MSQLQGTDGQIYQIGNAIGEGGFGVTYGAQRMSDGQAVVIKQLRVERLSDWKAVELFEREAQVLRSLRHERIPSYLDFVPLGDPRAPQGFALVQQHVSGETLQACISSGRRLEIAQMERWFVEVLEVLTYLHGLNPPVIHRDITPKNIILSAEGEAFLIDFGTVQAAMVSVTAVGSTTAGTFGYAPMEQFVGRATPSSDLYSLAITFVAVLLGQPPERMPFHNNHLDLNAALAGHQIDARLRLELERMVQPDPSRRPASAQEVIHNLNHRRPGQAHQSMPFGATPAGGSGPVQQAQISAAQSGAALAVSQEAQAAGVNQPWHKAMALRQRAGEQALWNPPPLMPFNSPDATAMSEDGRLIALIYNEGLAIVETQTMVVHDTGIDGWVSPEIAWAPGGQGLVVIDDFRDKYMVLPMGPQGPGQPHFLSQVAQDDVECLALSPDLKLIAVVDDWDEGRLLLMDSQSGSLVRELSPDDAVPRGDGYHRDFDGRRICFSPDGRLLAVSSRSDTVFYDTQGGTGHLKAGEVAFSPNGRALAFVPYEDDDTVRIVPDFDASQVVGLRPSSGQQLGVKLDDPEQLRFSADGRLLCCISRRDGEYEVVVIDLSSGQELWRAQAPYQGGLPIDSIEYAGLTPDGRLCIDAYTLGGAYSRDTSWHTVHIGSVAERRYLGALRLLASSSEVGAGAKVYINGVLVDPSQLASMGFAVAGADASDDDDEAQTELIPMLQGDTFPEEMLRGGGGGGAQSAQHASSPALESLQPEISLASERLLIGYTAEGFFSRLDAEPYVHRAGHAVSSYERQDITRSRMLGAPLHNLLSPDELAHVEDVEQRRRFFLEVKTSGQLAGDADLHELVAASRGLTPWLPYILDLARESGSQVAGFGQGQGEAMTLQASQIMAALAQLGQRDEAQKQVLFEQQSAKLHHLEQERARQLEAQKSVGSKIGGLFGGKKKQAEAQPTPHSPFGVASGSAMAVSQGQAVAEAGPGKAPVLLRIIGVMIQLASIAFALGYVFVFEGVFVNILPLLGEFTIEIGCFIGFSGVVLGSWFARKGREHAD